MCDCNENEGREVYRMHKGAKSVLVSRAMGSESQRNKSYDFCFYTLHIQKHFKVHVTQFSNFRVEEGHWEIQICFLQVFVCYQQVTRVLTGVEFIFIFF